MKAANPLFTGAAAYFLTFYAVKVGILFNLYYYTIILTFISFFIKHKLVLPYKGAYR